MTFAYAMLVSTAAFLVGMALGGPTIQTEVAYEDVEMQKMEKMSTEGMEKSESSSSMSGGVFQRLSNLKYVTAIQKSSIWKDVRRRTLTINSQVTSDIINKSPETMSDQELVLLKQACHDALKCVAVDQLLVLKTIKQQTSDGGHKTGVRKAITKITKVITEYTDELHHDTYEYFEVSETDDSSKVYQSVTTIVEDNRELCKSNDKNVAIFSDNLPASEGLSGSDDGPLSDNYNDDDVPIANDQGKQILQNFGTINNYNINQGTVNSAVINLNPSDGKSDSGTNDSSMVRVSLGSDNESASENDYQKSDPAQDEDSEREDDSYDDSLKRDQLESNSPSQTDYSAADPQTEEASGSGSDNTVEKAGHHNLLEIDNTNEGGCGDTNVDVAISGPNNESQVRKGYVDDGYLNNGDLKVYNINKGTINRGVINSSSADNGMISIGTINNGPINHKYYNDSSVNTTRSTFNNLDVQQYVSNIENMYSNILDDLH